jgi:hypothetical protein
MNCARRKPLAVVISMRPLPQGLCEEEMIPKPPLTVTRPRLEESMRKPMIPPRPVTVMPSTFPTVGSPGTALITPPKGTSRELMNIAAVFGGLVVVLDHDVGVDDRPIGEFDGSDGIPATMSPRMSEPRPWLKTRSMRLWL